MKIKDDKLRVAVVVSGWHFPLHFYEKIAEQKIPEGVSVDMFCISHRDPKYAILEKSDYLKKLGWSYRNTLDKVLYKKIASVDEIESLGWNYEEFPNTIGDWGNTNQWLEKNNYKNYDFLLVSHDDNLILNDHIYLDLISKKTDWLILTNSTGGHKNIRQFLKSFFRPIGVRGSFEIIKKEVLDLIGGEFDLSMVTKTREGIVESGDFKTLNNWNMVVEPITKVFNKKDMRNKIVALSKFYRVSQYCIEGERGYISSTQKENTKSENKGLSVISNKYDII